MKRILIALGFMLLAPFSAIADIDEFLFNANRSKHDYQECYTLFHAQNFEYNAHHYRNWRELAEDYYANIIQCQPFLSVNSLSWTAPPLDSTSSTAVKNTNSQSKSNTPSTLKAKLLELRTLVDDGLITEEDYEQAKKQMLNNM
jgi:hypothetical protein